MLADSNQVFKVVGTFIACRTSCLYKIAIDFAGITYILGPEDAVESGWTGGIMNPLALPYNHLDAQVVDNGDHIAVNLDNGVSVRWYKDKSAIIEIPESYMDTGMTGKYNAILPIFFPMNFLPVKDLNFLCPQL